MKLKCLVCGYKWEPRIKLPKQCPRCKRYDWNKEKEVEVERNNDN